LNESTDALEDFFSLHIKKWESDSGYSVYKFAPRRDFLRSLLNSPLGGNIVNIYYLSLNKKKIAVCFAFEISGKFLYYNFAHDPEYGKYSPGRVLLGKLMNYALENHYREFDFGMGDEEYKLKWPCKIRHIHNIYIYKADKDIYNLYLIFRRRILNVYLLFFLPALRKFRFAVRTWRLLKRRKGSYSRFK
jgi:CelD/BcsL family acetyltransferase involved in cellulose biosynthesis